MKPLVPLLLLAATACGPSPEARRTSPLPEGDRPSPAEASADPERAKPTDAPALALQALLNRPELTEYLHADELPERIPLRVADRGLLPTRPAVTSHGKPVRYVEAAEEGEALVLESFTLEAGRGAVRFRYPPEGIAGSADLEETNGVWRVSRLSITEESAAQAAGPTFRNPADLPAAWTDCAKDTCVMVRNDCCDAWSVASASKDAAAKEMNLRRNRMTWRGPIGDPPCRRSCATPGPPTCDQGRCGFGR